MPNMSTNAMIGLILLCLSFISSLWATADFDIRELKRSVKALGTSFVHEKFITAQKAESRSVTLFSEVAPTYSETGFMIVSVAEDASCSFPTVTYGSVVNSCVVADKYSYKIRLTQDSCEGGVIQYFSDKTCLNTTLLGTSALTDSDLSCRGTGTPLYGGSYTSISCTTYDVPRLLYDSAVTNDYVPNSECSPEKLDGYFALKLDHCFNAEAEVSNLLRVTCEDDLVTWNYHALRTACAIDPRESFTYPDTCMNDAVAEALTDDPSDDDRVILRPPPSISSTPFPTASAEEFVPYNTSSLTYCATANAPTFAPTVLPTARPTTAFPTYSKAKQVTFDADQTVDGITISAYTNRKDFHAGILKQAIADSMIDVTPEDIIQWEVTETPASAERTGPTTTQSYLRAMALRVLAVEASSIDLSYRVQVETTLSTDRVMSLLQNSVNSGAFTKRLQELALVNNAGALLSASSTSVSTVAVRKPKNGPGPATTNEIIGIVVGVTALSLIILGVITHKSCLPTF